MRNYMFSCMMALCIAIHAQQQYIVTKSEFHGPGENIDLFFTETTTSKSNLYLYNVGQDLFLNAGGYWGTQGMVFTVGLPVTLTKLSNGNYTIHGPFKNTSGQGEGEYFAYVKESSGGTGFYWDRGTDYEWTLTPITGYSSGDDTVNATEFVYELKSNGKYMYAGGDLLGGTLWGKPKTGIYDSTDQPSKLKDSDTKKYYGYWKIVTEEEIKANFENTYTNRNPSDASFLIRAQNFNRMNSYNDGTSAGNVGKDEGTGGAATGEGWYKHLVEGSTMSCVTNANTSAFGVSPAASSDDQYGMFYNACLTNGKDGDMIYQKIKVPKSGWYRLDCEGFFHNETATEEPLGELFARLSSETSRPVTPSSKYAYASLPSKASKETPGTPGEGADPDADAGIIASMKEAGQAFFYEYYPNYVMIYVPVADGTDGTEIEIGIEVTKDMGSGDFLCFDDFGLKFLGEEVVLSENDTDIIPSTIYPSGDNNYYQNRTLLLERKFTMGKWNTLTLPFNVTKEQFFSTFKSTAKLAEFKGFASPASLKFQLVSLDTKALGDVVMEKDKNYIIYTDFEGKTEKYTSHDKAQRKISSYYVIERVSLNKQTIKNEILERKKNNGNGHHRGETFTSADNECKVTFCGTYVYLDKSEAGNVVPQGSFAFSGGDLYHLSKDMKMKAYRSWIEDEHQTGAANSTKRHTFSVSFNGISDDTTAIEGITGDGPLSQHDANDVYTLTGICIRPHALMLDGLPRGIYVVNGRKHIVR